MQAGEESVCRQEMCVCELVIIWSVGVGKAAQCHYNYGSN